MTPYTPLTDAELDDALKQADYVEAHFPQTIHQETVGYLRRLVAEVRERRAVDARRVTLRFESGGSMIVEETEDRISGIMPVDGIGDVVIGDDEP